MHTIIDFQRKEHLLELVRQSILKHKEIERAKGEAFNVFSILRLERAENRTHSAFIAELLNPSGSHLLGDTFLASFQETIGHPLLDTSTAVVFTEHNLGLRDYETKSGGRADILLKDGRNNCLIIENKIDARDQEAQLERYCRYMNGRNGSVFYLNKFGEEPSDLSKGKLKRNEDFHIISYKQHIIPWLEQCIRVATDFPILRESLKQYLLLIKKITNTMNNESQKELEVLMIKYFDEAKSISDQFIPALYRITEGFRRDTFSLLQEKLVSQFAVTEGWPTSKEYAQLWVRYKSFPKAKVLYGIESFSPHYKEPLRYGIFVEDRHKIAYECEDDLTLNEWFPYHQYIPQFDHLEVCFSDKELLTRIVLNTEFRAALMEHIVKHFVSYIERHKDGLEAYIATLADKFKNTENVDNAS